MQKKLLLMQLYLYINCISSRYIQADPKLALQTIQRWEYFFLFGEVYVFPTRTFVLFEEHSLKVSFLNKKEQFL